MLQDERIKILKSSLEDKLQIVTLREKIDWEDYGSKTENWVAQDLVVLTEKVTFAAWKRHGINYVLLLFTKIKILHYFILRIISSSQ